MPDQSPFDQFAPAILKVYHRDKEAFWSAVMAPFLSNRVSMLGWMQHLRADRQRVRDSYRTSKDMIARSRAILHKLGDRFLVRLVDVTELRVENYFRKELGLTEIELKAG